MHNAAVSVYANVESKIWGSLSCLDSGKLMVEQPGTPPPRHLALLGPRGPSLHPLSLMSHILRLAVTQFRQKGLAGTRQEAYHDEDVCGDHRSCSGMPCGRWGCRYASPSPPCLRRRVRFCCFSRHYIVAGDTSYGIRRPFAMYM